jgi:hypothetical protein
MTLLSADFEQPLFYCPIPPAINPAADAIERDAIKWIDQVGVYTTDLERQLLIDTRSAEFYARFAPLGRQENTLTAALWVYWGFSFDDDKCDDGPLSADPTAFLPMAGRLQHVLAGSVSPTDLHAAALHDVAARMRACATPVQMRRFIDAHRHWLYCVAWQIANNAACRMPTVGEYLAMRLGSAGGPPTIALLEIAMGVEVPGHDMDTRTVRALTDLTCLIASLDNDMHSYRKEAEQETHTDQNLVNVIRCHERCSLAEATARATSVRDRLMVRFLRLRERAYSGAGEELSCYLDCLGHAIRGNIDWAARVPRYVSEGSPGQSTAPIPATTTSQPQDVGSDALPFAEISWWWDDDLGT